ncbi:MULTISPECIES: hypothetical protein [Clostridium]|uniref:Uncharacterized protein n=1 Tax=Clostridium novyi (strain NT) TaxID=386415 RepID=A0PY54_CLONN|nr:MULTISPECIES: hypothetical protein [Clostridium]ABK61169.1 hypothetical protein NT01CX_1223 [Clostridium novyi NT]KEH87888.1 hypothetical protein Z966_09825 [Clostridium novyi A str. NCTC 538]KEH90115.1 hypothetical protein Z967_00380 [Clostridium novyi A str. 4540]KEH91263.1 hypothetical protein Z965_03615 [Clostridium novyi A str. BKT29909]KEH94666.1 hypothetical protein Z963_08825 [Clostridium botulinum C/D str. It1]
MLFNKDIIPLYVNNNLMNNLFTVLVQEFKQSMTVTTRSQQIIKIDTPLANVMKGRYVQGRFNLDLLNEFSRQRTEESMSMNIWILLQTRGILYNNNLLKNIENKDDVSNIMPGEYVEFRCTLNKNPQVRQIENIINCLKMKQIFGYTSKNNISETIELLSKYLNAIKEDNCLKCYTDGICGTDVRAIMPIQMKYLQDNLDSQNKLGVTVMGKVLRKEENSKEGNINLCGGTCCDYLTQKYIDEFKKRYLEDTDLIDRNMYKNIINKECPLIELLPLAMYI